MEVSAADSKRGESQRCSWEDFYKEDVKICKVHDFYIYQAELDKRKKFKKWCNFSHNYLLKKMYDFL